MKRYFIKTLPLLLCPMFSMDTLATDWGRITSTTVMDSGDTATSVWFSDSTDSLTVSGSGGVTIDNTSAPNYYPIYAYNGASVNLGTGSIVRHTYTTSGTIYTISISGTNTTLTADDLSIITNITDSTSSIYSLQVGVYSTLNLTGTTTINYVNNSTSFTSIIDSLVVRNYSTANIENLDITSLLQSGTLQILAVEYTGQLYVTGNAIITGTIYGADAEIIGLTVVSTSSANAGLAVFDGTAEYNLTAGNDGQSLLGTEAIYGTITYNSDLTVNIDTQDYSNVSLIGIQSIEGGKHILNGKTIVNFLNAANTTDVTYFLSAYDEGTIEINGESVFGTSTTPLTQTAFYLSNGGTITSQNQKMTLYGNILNDASTVDLALTDSSYLRSYISTTNGGVTSIALDGASVWDMTDSSTLTDLTFTDSSSQVNFLSDASTSTYYTLTVDNLSGTGNFTMNEDIVNDLGDQIIVTGTTAGSHLLTIANDATATTDGTETRTVVLTADGNGTFTSNEVELGGYVYQLEQIGNDWVLVAKTEEEDDDNSSSDDSSDDGSTEEISTGGTKTISTTANAAVNFINANYRLNYINLHSLYQRMGVLRSQENKNGDVWIRGLAGRLESYHQGSVRQFKMKYTGVQFGADRYLTQGEADLYLGAAVGFSRGLPKYDHQGTGTVQEYNFNLYASYVLPSNFYIDTVAKYSHSRNEFDVRDTLNQPVHGSASSNGGGLSIESGQRFYLEPQKTYYVEPQVQLSYFHQRGSNFTNSNQLRVHLSSYDSLIGRINTQLGYDMKKGPLPLNAYMSVGYAGEMLGNTSYQLNTSKADYKLSNGWFEGKLGATAYVQQSHHIYSDITYSYGSRVKDTQFNLGYRYRF